MIGLTALNATTVFWINVSYDQLFAALWSSKIALVHLANTLLKLPQIS